MIEAAPLLIGLLVLLAGALSLALIGSLFHPDRDFKGPRDPLKSGFSLEPSSETRTAAGRMYAAPPFATSFRRAS
jgi:hypothetical protein